MLQYRSCNMLRYSLSCNMLVWMCSAHVNQRSSKNCIIPLGFGVARGDYIGLGFLTQTICDILLVLSCKIQPRDSDIYT